MNKTPRMIQVSMGRPDIDEEEPGEDTSHILSPDDSYVILFVEECEEGEEGTGFTAQCNCLCGLTAGAEAWLMGKTAEEVQAVMAKKVDGHNSHE